MTGEHLLSRDLDPTRCGAWRSPQTGPSQWEFSHPGGGRRHGSPRGIGPTPSRVYPRSVRDACSGCTSQRAHLPGGSLCRQLGPACVRSPRRRWDRLREPWPRSGTRRRPCLAHDLWRSGRPGDSLRSSAPRPRATCSRRL